MLSKKYRAKSNLIEETVKSGKTVSGNLLYAKISRMDNENPSFSIIIPKKVAKTSVRRHYIKRKLSGILEKEIKSMKDSFKKTIVFFAKKPEPLNFDEAKSDIVMVLKTAGFFSE
jgi:ribonuclease P protein component